MNNIYIIEEVLNDYTPGIATIAASSLDRARELFAEEFDGDRRWMDEFDAAIANGDFKVIEAVYAGDETMISYGFGGG